MKKIRAAVVGYGNVGKYTVDAIVAAGDMELAGVVRRKKTGDEPYPVVTSIDELEGVDVALLGVPTRRVPEYCEDLLSRGINTVDSYDIHDVREMKQKLNTIARENGAVSLISTGIDPGVGSLTRGMFLFMAPLGISYTNYGPGMSMGHTVAVKNIEGVRDALSLTIPKGTGMHKRVVYVEMEEGADLEEITRQVKADPYFSNDETHVFPTEKAEDLINMGHKLHVEREGVASEVHNQSYELKLQAQNPALTAQVMVASARASTRMDPGAYTMLEVPLINFIEGDKEKLINDLI